MAVQWMNMSNGLDRNTYIRRTPTSPISIHPFSPKSISSSSSWSSSQESLNISGGSPENYHRFGLKPQDRLRRIRESHCQPSNKMELDEELDYFHDRSGQNANIKLQYNSPMIIDNEIDSSNVTKTAHYSSSLRLKYYRESQIEKAQNHQKCINFKSNSNRYHPWQNETSSTKPNFSYSNSKLMDNIINVIINNNVIPRWIIPALSMTPLRRPQKF